MPILPIPAAARRLLIMGVTITVVPDEQMAAWVQRTLADAGFVGHLVEYTVRIEGAGVGLGDHSVDVDVQTVLVEGVRILLLSSLLNTEPGTFDAAAVACARGNGACAIAKFEVVEVAQGDQRSLFGLRASLPLFAEHLSAEEFARMTWLFVRETDAIDNELADIMARG